MRPVGSVVPGAVVADSEPMTISELAGDSPTLLVFFKEACATCEIALPVYQHWRSQVEVIGVSQDDPDTTSRFFREHGIDMRVVFDAPAFEASTAFDIDAVPAVFLVDDGRISWSGVGWSTEQATELAELIAERSGTEPLLVGTAALPVFRPG